MFWEGPSIIWNCHSLPVVCSEEEVWRSCLEHNTLDSCYDKTTMEMIAQWIFLTKNGEKSGFSSVFVVVIFFSSLFRIPRLAYLQHLHDCFLHHLTSS